MVSQAASCTSTNKCGFIKLTQLLAHIGPRRGLSMAPYYGWELGIPILRNRTHAIFTCSFCTYETFINLNTKMRFEKALLDITSVLFCSWLIAGGLYCVGCCYPCLFPYQPSLLVTFKDLQGYDHLDICYSWSLNQLINIIIVRPSQLIISRPTLTDLSLWKALPVGNGAHRAEWKRSPWIICPLQRDQPW